MLQAVPIHHVVPIADLSGRDYFFGSLWRQREPSRRVCSEFRKSKRSDHLSLQHIDLGHSRPSFGVEAPPAQRSLLLSEAPSPSAHLERPDVAADGRHARRVTPTGTIQVLLPKDRSSGDLHHTHAARRHRRSLNTRRVKAWTPAARSYKR